VTCCDRVGWMSTTGSRLGGAVIVERLCKKAAAICARFATVVATDIASVPQAGSKERHAARNQSRSRR